MKRAMYVVLLMIVASAGWLRADWGSAESADFALNTVPEPGVVAAGIVMAVWALRKWRG